MDGGNRMSEYGLLRILPFPNVRRYPERPSYAALGLPELAAADPIPF